MCVGQTTFRATIAAAYDLLLASLGACTAMTVRLHARQKGLPLGAVEVELSHTRVHVEDCSHTDAPDAFISRIERTICLAGPLSDAQKAELMAIAEKCPVHRTLTGKVEIHSTLRESAASSAAPIRA